MLNDERINKELSNLKKYIIMLSIVICSIFLGIKLFYATQFRLSIIYYFTEIAIILIGSVILIGRLFIRSEVKDEAYYERIHRYYNKSFIIFVFLSFLSFSFVMGAMIINFGNFSSAQIIQIGEGVTVYNQCFSSAKTINLIMFLSLFIGYAYIRYKNIYFNYSIVEENSNSYYVGVFKNILKIVLFFLIIYSVGVIATIFYINNSHYGLTQKDFDRATTSIIIAFFTSSISVSLYYFVISLFEKSLVKEENKKITISTITLIILGLIANILFLFLLLVSNALDMQIIENPLTPPKQMLYSAHRVGVSLQEIAIHLQLLGSVFLVYDITKNSKILRKKFNVPILLYVLYNCFALITIKADPMILEYIQRLKLTEISQIAIIKYVVLNLINFGILLSILIVIIINLHEQLSKHKGISILLVANYLIIVLDFAISFLAYECIFPLRNIMKISWLVILLILFVNFAIKANKNKDKIES